MRVALISTYELGRQPFGMASAAAWLEDAGAEVTVQDLAVCAFEPDPIRGAALVGVYVPMHTATRLAEQVIARVRDIEPDAHIACFGLYAAMNAEHLRSLGADTIIGGEFEPGLVSAYRSVTSGAPIADDLTSIERSPFQIPIRSGLPELDKYARFKPGEAPTKVTGYTEATRGCKHMCRHCPIVPVYGGRFTVVDPDVVIADVSAQVAAGAEHITFGDPDFFNGPVHAMRIVRRLHEEFPGLTYDVTIKVEHLANHIELLPELKETGCALVTTAVESFDDAILERFDKGHDAADLERVLVEMRRIDLPINPTFVTFTPWTTAEGYMDLLARIADLGLVDNVSPIQYGIRLLVPSGSLLLDLPDADVFGDFDPAELAHPWTHPDQRMDALHEQVMAIVEPGPGRREGFAAVWRAARGLVDGDWPIEPPLDEAVPVATVPYLTEPWYC